MSRSAILTVKILADATQAAREMDKASGKTSKWSSGMNRAAGVAAIGLAAVGAVAVKGVKAAAEDAQAQAILAKALKNSAGASDEAVAATEDWITKTAMATGVADDQLRPALGNLVRATGSVEESQKAMGLALDISAATGKDVESVSKALAKGYGGQTTALGRLVPGMDKAVLASGDMAAVSAELASKVGGSAAAAADTAAGKYQRLQVGMDELVEGIGAALLPILTILATKLAGVATWATENQSTVTILVGAFAALAATIIAVNAVTKAYIAISKIVKAVTVAWRVAQFALNVALMANPIGLVILLVVALVAIIVIAYKKSETFRRIVNAAFQGVLTAAKTVWNWIKSSWPTIQAVITRPIQVAVGIVKTAWDSVKAAAKSVFDWLGNAWRNVVNRLKNIAGTLAAPIVNAFNAVKSAIQGVIDMVNRVINAIRSIPKPSIPDLNPFNAPAPSRAVATANGARVGGFRGGARAGAPVSGVVVNVNGALDPDSVARQIRAILTGHDIRVGRAVVPGGRSI